MSAPRPIRRAAALAAAALLVLLAAVATAVPAARAQEPPRVQAPSAILVEASTGDVVYQRNAGERRPIASTTKLMTALLALEGIALDDVLTAPGYQAGAAESVVGLREGERMTVRDLLRALLLPSANDAAVALAQGLSGSTDAFVDEMNRRAEQLRLRDTSYANPIGLDEPGNRSSARDLVKLAIVLRRKPFFRETVDLPRVTLRSGARTRTIVNRNTLVRQVPLVDGVKTGRTEQAGYVLVGSATRGGVTVVSAVLGEPSEAARDADTLALLRYGLSRYRRRTVLREGQPLRTADLRFRDEDVRLVAAETVQRVLRRGERARARVVAAPEELDGPLPAGAEVGTVEVRVRGKVVERVPLVTASAVAEATLTDRVASVLARPASILLVVLLVGCTVLLALLRRRVVRRAGGAR
ncbi:MAG TPA: D-alanyl-D-alanine carboxypeptidase family protein [Solirubrobacteraceae bacterium]|nr:D-alanyl-D-alanine carboxypeptidase family protein [Solirubrobacteraceae bacterium]